LPDFVLHFSKTPTRQNETETDMKRNGKHVACNETGTFFCQLLYVYLSYSYCNRNMWNMIIALCNILSTPCIHVVCTHGMSFVKNMSTLQYCDFAAMLHCKKILVNGGDICGQELCDVHGSDSDCHCTLIITKNVHSLPQIWPFIV